ncbi:MAG: glycosyltransferase family 4 protein [Chloroflexi bacterium AL-W]|nr:glycosyltransferase family 4 protein [Chloroflexi bacterium AL-N1]NOK65647.1 glycosyltransferase family 4 protein [Chloroflexi bacterium AL-N10]NOK74412.1 glycosyltransferase family 4 protein [Chloroflexi bacterium AL-N5]NOK80680.1 glycosyltransferase family 4 protein [Chloroflexi bacterium AL-W]NOK88670.1 glycosyltransferase family 4 protein [Chloroflexi bacterium AL-N15]
MRIAQVVPMYEAVPPKGYGGTERVVSYLTEELVQRGHDVTLFASADSCTAARLIPTVDHALREHTTAEEIQELAAPLHLAMLSEVFQYANDFDIMHCHVEYLSFGFAPFVRTPSVTTLHGRLDFPYLKSVLRRLSDTALISISHHQRAPLDEVHPHWVGTVYNAVPVSEFPFSTHAGKYLLFVGRISPEKRVDWAIEIAKRSGMPLKIVAKIDPCEQDYYENEIAPLLDHPLIEYVGEADERTKRELMQHAYALVFPINWPEPFGMVMIEAMACGTPVLALNRGAVPEVLRHGMSGFIGQSIEDLVDAVPYVTQMDRRLVRYEAERRFSTRAMADNYEQVYRRVIAERQRDQLAIALGAHPRRVPISA